MIRRATHPFSDDLRALFLVGAIGGMDDDALVCLYVEGDDASSREAFTAIFVRYGDLVTRVCRDVLRDPADVDDAVQATFLVLARRARGLRRPDQLAAWLHGVALRTARRAKTRDRDRIARDSTVGSASWRSRRSELPENRAIAVEEAEAIHEEVGRLPEKFREAAILCLLRGLTHEEAARRLGIPVGTMSARVVKARAVLRVRLERRGLDLSAMAAGLASPVVANVGATLAFQVSRGGFAAPAGINALSQGVLRGMLMSKIKVAACVLVMVAAGGALATVLARSDDPPVAKPQAIVVQNDLPEGARQRIGSTILRHGGSVVGSTFSPDGSILASFGWGGAVRFWNPKTGTPAEGIPTLQEATAPLAVVYSPDGTKLAIGRSGGVVQIWDIAGRKEIMRTNVHQGRVGGLAFSPDGQTLASASDEETRVLLWDATTGEPRQTLEFDDRSTSSGQVAFSPGGDQVALAVSSRTGAGETIRIWDLGGAREPTVIRKAHGYGVTSVAFLGIGRTLISGGVNYRDVRDQSGATKYSVGVPAFRIWDVVDGHRVKELAPVGVEGGGAFAVARDGRKLVSAHWGYLLVWDLEAGVLEKTIPLDPTISNHFQP